MVATRDLTAARFPEPGSRRLVCLADGGSAIEEVLRHQPGRLLTYVVWGYTSAAAQPPAYGFGAFRFTDDGDATRVDWTYAFRLKSDRFPGNLGALGRDLFRLAFLDTNSARFMQAGMAAIERESLAAAP
ncbi:SRPBCC family protein [Falsiroseomonas sp. HC035]|uniref:SRPBCC family protein n=1 Tax=Falsiroseomonas sp. HC035 TaxID=3390999 RepID=UPI003D31A503